MSKWFCAALAPLAATFAFGATPDTYALVNGRIYTQNSREPWAESLIVSGERIVYVGKPGTVEWTQLVCPSTLVHNLRKRLVIPGFVDGHTHPGLVSILGSGDPQRDEREMMPAPGRVETLAWLRHYASTHQGEKWVMVGAWDVASFLPTGPDKRDLDTLWPTTPALIFDNSGHSFWFNSAGLKALGVNANFTPQWFGLAGLGRAGAIARGHERAQRDELAGTFWRSGANVTFSSDVISSAEMPRSNPFVGLEMGITRRDYQGSVDPDRRLLPEERLTLSQALSAYSINGARQLGIGD